jgi:hypothetical protein
MPIKFGLDSVPLLSSRANTLCFLWRRWAMARSYFTSHKQWGKRRRLHHGRAVLWTLPAGVTNNSFNHQAGSNNSKQVMRQLFKEINWDKLLLHDCPIISWPDMGCRVEDRVRFPPGMLPPHAELLWGDHLPSVQCLMRVLPRVQKHKVPT